MVPLCPRRVEEEEDTVQRLLLASAFPWASLLSLLVSAAMRAPEGAPSWGLVITGKIHQLFLPHGSSVAELLYCCLGTGLLCDKSQFLLALNALRFQSGVRVQCCSEQSWGQTTAVGFGSCHISWHFLCWHFAALCHFTLVSMAAFSTGPSALTAQDNTVSLGKQRAFHSTVK